MDKPNQTSFKKGHKPWNTGKVGVEAYGAITKARDCRRCGDSFIGTMAAQKYCDRDCADLKKNCLQCRKEFVSWPHSVTYCSIVCAASASSVKRMGDKNPAYTDGHTTWANNKGRSIYTSKHFGACKKYRAAFLEKHGYPFCEVCGINEMGTPKFEVHHIYFASLWPKHDNLHDFRNLIHICLGCHMKFHAGKQYQAEFEKLEKDRGLKDLFSAPIVKRGRPVKV